MALDINRILILLLLLGLLFTLYKYQQHINKEYDDVETTKKKKTKKKVKKLLEQQLVMNIEKEKEQEKEQLESPKNTDLISNDSHYDLGSLADDNTEPYKVDSSANSLNSDEMSLFNNQSDDGSSSDQSEDSFFFRQEYS